MGDYMVPYHELLAVVCVIVFFLKRKMAWGSGDENEGFFDTKSLRKGPLKTHNLNLDLFEEVVL